MSLTIAPMQQADVPAVLDIIGMTDEEDATWANHTYQHQGIINQYVARDQRGILGTTGFRHAMETDRAYWLSWTYVHPHYQSAGIGSTLLQHVVDELGQRNGRKLFVSTSDYRDENDRMLYENAFRLYKQFGFEMECHHANYYDDGESQVIFGLPLTPAIGLPVDATYTPGSGPVVLGGIGLIEETDDCYAVDWHFAERDESPTTPVHIEAIIRKASKKKARSLFVSFESTQTQIASLFTSAGFYEDGRLSDFFTAGVHEIRYRIDF